MTGRHRKPGDLVGPDKMYPTHSAEERTAETGTLTRADLQRAVGIVPRDTPPGGLPMKAPPHRRARPRYHSTPDEGGPAQRTPTQMWTVRNSATGQFSHKQKSDQAIRKMRVGVPGEEPTRTRILVAVGIIVILAVLIALLGGWQWA